MLVDDVVCSLPYAASHAWWCFRSFHPDTHRHSTRTHCTLGMKHYWAVTAYTENKATLGPIPVKSKSLCILGVEITWCHLVIKILRFRNKHQQILNASVLSHPERISFNTEIGLKYQMKAEIKCRCSLTLTKDYF